MESGSETAADVGGPRDGFGDGPVETGQEAAIRRSARRLFDATQARLLQEAGATPLATYRLQLTPSFGFDAARDVASYLARLGVTDVYCSPYLQAATGSQHGYDVVDHRSLNVELGGEEGHARLCDELRRLGLGQILDVVPNHAGIGQENPLWWDVLENGPASLYAEDFDIDWRPVKKELRDKLLLPVLGDQYGVVLENGELKLAYEEGAFRIRYWEHAFPVEPKASRRVLKHDLDALIERLGEKDPGLVELESILTALAHLPDTRDREPGKRAERAREKEVIRRRLAACVEGHPAIVEHVNRAVAAFNGTPGDPRSFDLLDDLLAECSYRLAHWRVAVEEINYRRFFDINDLAALRVESPEVFERTHQKVFQLLGEGKLTGLRIDHPDGLLDPTAYFLALQQRYFLERARRLFLDEGLAGAEEGPEDDFEALRGPLEALWTEAVSERSDTALRKALYIVVEKIQGGKERIPDNWAVHGTTGYRFANAATGVFVQRHNARHLTESYTRFVGERRFDFHRLVYEKKKLILMQSMSSELNGLARELNRISEMNRRSRDFTLNSLRRALAELIAIFPVYRTYLSRSLEVDERDREYLLWTLKRARQLDVISNASLFDFIEGVLLRRGLEELGEEERRTVVGFTLKLQQLTGPVMAKGVEDTVFYLYNRLVSLNEVGGEPEEFGTTDTLFHLRNQERAESWPRSMLTSTTHDTKRGEDVRARISVLSEVPQGWRQAVRRWARRNARLKSPLGEGLAPTPNEEYLFYQTLVGSWPVGRASEPEVWGVYRERLRAYMQKAVKEAKVHTSWMNANEQYEAVLDDFVARTLSWEENPGFLRDVDRWVQRIAAAGWRNALGQLVLKLASPGVCDVYQGTELWDDSLVDPDNRRPVDFALRTRLLHALEAELAVDEANRRESSRASGGEPSPVSGGGPGGISPGRLGLCRRLAADLEDGHIKFYVLRQGLHLRRRFPELFRRGDYLPLEVQGERAEHVIAFARRLEDVWVVCVTPRFTLALEEPGISIALGQTFIRLPEGAPMGFEELFTGALHAADDSERCLNAGRLLADFPVALLLANAAAGAAAGAPAAGSTGEPAKASEVRA